MKTKYNIYIERCRASMSKRKGEITGVTEIAKDYEKHGKNTQPYKDAIGFLISIGEWSRLDGKFKLRNKDNALNELSLAIDEVLPGFKEKLLKKKNVEDMTTQAHKEAMKDPHKFAEQAPLLLEMIIDRMKKDYGALKTKTKVRSIMKKLHLEY